MKRPVFLSKRNGEPSSVYRMIVNECNDIFCALGINGLINRIGRLLAWSWTSWLNATLNKALLVLCGPDLEQDWPLLAWSWTGLVSCKFDLEQDYSSAELLLNRIGHTAGLILNRIVKLLGWSWTGSVSCWLDLEQDWCDMPWPHITILNLINLSQMQFLCNIYV